MNLAILQVNIASNEAFWITYSQIGMNIDFLESEFLRYLLFAKVLAFDHPSSGGADTGIGTIEEQANNKNNCHSTSSRN